jgi:hypothetical protein
LTFTKLFALTPNDRKYEPEWLGDFPHGARLATFTPDGEKIVLVTPSSEVQIHPFRDQTALTAEFPYIGPKGTWITHIAVSSDVFAVSSSDSLVVLQNFDPNSTPQILPKSDSAVTSLNFLTEGILAVTLAEGNRLLLFERDMELWRLHRWSSRAENMPRQFAVTQDKCLGTFACGDNRERVWLWGANWLAWIKLNEMQDKTAKDNGEFAHWISYRYREVLLVECVRSSTEGIELVVVERPRHEIMEDITEPRFYRHEYGT